MEKAPGIQLVKTWSNMKDYEHFILIKNLCALESEMAALKFPAYGSLYLREFLQTTGHESVPLDEVADPRGRFCVGPSSDRAWHEGKECGVSRVPWLDLAALGQALVDREFSHLDRTPIAKEPGSHQLASKPGQRATLQLAAEAVTRMGTDSLPGRFANPTLWHTDLHLGNIYVSEEDPTQIVSIIDWQSLLILPLFCQVGFPEFLELPEDYEIGAPVPKRPDNLAEYEHKQICMGKAYEGASWFKNKQVFKALRLPTYFKDLFVRCGEVSKEGVTPLRACLIELPKEWAETDCTGDCPIQFTPDDLAKHEREFEDYSSFHRIRAIARGYLDTDSEGWIPPGIHIEVKRKRNQELLQLMTKRSAEYGKTPEEVREIWPY